MSTHDHKPLLLFVDDDADIQSAARLLFRQRGVDIVSAHDTRNALTQLAAHAIDLVLLDLNYSRGATNGAEGLELLKDMLILRPELPVVVVTGHSGVSIAVEAMRAGARDFVMKPWNNDRLVALVCKTLADSTVDHDAVTESVMIVASPELDQIVAEADRLARTRAPIIVCGPEGSGKSLLARRISAMSRHTGGEILIRAKECDMLPQGSGNWVVRDIESLAPALQRQLIDRLDEPDAPRVIALSCLDRCALNERLDPKLMLHLGMIVLSVPPLTKRPNDVVALTAHFLRYFSTRHGLAEPRVDENRLATLKAGVWPQNVRSLRAMMERVVLTGDWETLTDNSRHSEDSPKTLQATERVMIEAALRKHSFNVAHAARELGLTRPALYRRMARYGL